jgi:hypothetical protein
MLRLPKLINEERTQFFICRCMDDGTNRYSVSSADQKEVEKMGVNMNDTHGHTFVVKRTSTIKDEIVQRVTEVTIPEVF